MNLKLFLGKKVYIVLLIDWIYTGWVKDADEKSITLKDKKGEMVYLHQDAIKSIRECF